MWELVGLLPRLCWQQIHCFRMRKKAAPFLPDTLAAWVSTQVLYDRKYVLAPHSMKPCGMEDGCSGRVLLWQTLWFIC